MARSSCLIAKDIQSDVDSNVHWDLEYISKNFAQWLGSPYVSPASFSRVGILCSFKLIHLLSDFLPEILIQHFRLLMETSSILYYNGNPCGYAEYSHIDLCLVRSFLGTKVLNGLEKALASTALAKATVHELQALFLMLFGTIIAVSYSDQWSFSDMVSISFCQANCQYRPVSTESAKITVFMSVQMDRKLVFSSSEMSSSQHSLFDPGSAYVRMRYPQRPRQEFCATSMNLIADSRQ